MMHKPFFKRGWPLLLGLTAIFSLASALTSLLWMLALHFQEASKLHPASTFVLITLMVAVLAALLVRGLIRKQLEAIEGQATHLNQALQEASQAHENTNRMIAYLGHDLRSPLGTIVHYVQLLGSSRGQLSRHYQEVIERSVTHQLELIDDLMEYTRGELEQLNLFPAPTYLHAFLEEIAHQGELLAEQRGNRFRMLVRDGIPAVGIIDAKRLKQVLMNLLSNASKFTESGAIRMQVEFTSVGEPHLRFSVSDTGTGISEEDLDGIFQPYERRSEEQPGYGLGLAIAGQIVKKMGSELKVDSAPGMGSRFWFELPLDIAEESDVLLPLQAFAIPEPFGAGKRILILDRNASTRDYLTEILSLADFDVICVDLSSEAEPLLQEGHFGMILATQTEHGDDAWRLLRKVQQYIAECPPPVILYTAAPPQRPKGFPDNIDFDEILLKPISAEKLLQILRDYFEEDPLAASDPNASPSTQIPESMFAKLREMIAFGNITDVMEWATEIERDYPDQADFTFALRNAALRIDIKALTLLASRQR